MSKKMLGGFSQFMSAATKEAAAAEAEATAKDTILNIDVDNLVPDPNNKYGMRDIDLLASMMEANQFHGIWSNRLACRCSAPTPTF